MGLAQRPLLGSYLIHELFHENSTEIHSSALRSLDASHRTLYWCSLMHLLLHKLWARPFITRPSSSEGPAFPNWMKRRAWGEPVGWLYILLDIRSAVMQKAKLNKGKTRKTVGHVSHILLTGPYTNSSLQSRSISQSMHWNPGRHLGLRTEKSWDECNRVTQGGQSDGFIRYPPKRLLCRLWIKCQTDRQFFICTLV